MFSSPVARFVLLAALLVAGLVLLYRSRPPAAPAQQPGRTAVAQPVEDRQALVAGLFQGSLLGAVDGKDFEETPSYDRLLHHVKAMPRADFSARVTGRLDWAAAVQHPERWRGEFVRVRGLLADISAVKLHGAEPGLEDVYRGFMGQPDGTELIAFDCVDVPPELKANKDVLDIEGVFYRTVGYESKSGERREVPYLIVRNLSVYQQAVAPVARETLVSLGWKLLAVIAGSALAAFLLLRWTGRRRSPALGAAGPPGFRAPFQARPREDRRPQDPHKTE